MSLQNVFLSALVIGLCSCSDERTSKQNELELAEHGSNPQGEEGLTLKGTAFRPEYQNLELVGFYLHEDRNLVSEGGSKTDEKAFLRTIELARKYPPQFLVEFILFPELESNNDLQLIQRWCELCDRHEIPWIITIRPEASKPVRFLYENPPADAPEGDF